MSRLAPRGPAGTRPKSLFYPLKGAEGRLRIMHETATVAPTGICHSAPRGGGNADRTVVPNRGRQPAAEIVSRSGESVVNGNRIPPCRPHGLHTLDPGRHASSGAPGAPWRFAGVLRSSRSRSRPGGRSQRPVVAALLAALAFLLLAAPAEAQSGVPGAPTGVMITQGHKAVKLDWTAPADGGSAIIEYQVHVGEIRGTGSTSTSYVTETGNFSSIIIIRVRAVNANGNGPWSSNTATETGPATVTIAGEGDPNAGEGAGSEFGWVEFTLTTDRPVLSASQPLDVSVLVSETEDMLPSGYEGAQTASFALNSATHILQLSPTTDTTQESDSVVTATIQTSTDYTVGTPSSATVTILDDDGPPERPVTGLTVAEGHYSFRAEWDTYVPGPGEPHQALYEIQFSDFEPSFRAGDTAYEWASPGPADFDFRVRAVNSTQTDRHGPWSDPVPVRHGGATVTIAGNGPVSEGGDAVFTLTTDRENRHGVNGKSVLIVDVLVSETDDVVASANEKVHTVTFPVGNDAATTVTLTVPTVDDNKDERDSVVTPTIQTAPSAQVRPYTVGSPASATVRVANDDFGNFERRRLDSCGVSAPHSSGHAIECFQLVGSSHVRTPEGMAERGYAPSRNNPLEVGDIVAMEGVPDDWVISVLGEKVDAVVVTIAAGTSPVPEGTEVEFTVTRATAATTHLSVTVGVAETQDMMFNSAAWPNRVDILANATAATFLVMTDDDDVDETNSVITATVNAGNGYTAGTSGSASVTVQDNDDTPPGTQQAGTPGAPRDFSARPAGESRIDLSWTAPAGEPTGYEIEWSADGETDWTAVDPAHAGTAAEYADEGLDGGTTRYYRVRAFNEAGDGEWSAVANATTNLHLVLEGPGAPEDLSASASGASRIDLSWTAPEGEVTGYAVEWSGDGETGWAAVDPEHSGTATEYAHTGLTANTAYYYRVLALADAVPGEWSDVASATTDSATRQRGEPPAAPGNVSADASGQSRIEVSWSAPKGEVTGYEVEWSADGSGSWTAADPAHSGTATGYSDTGLDAGTTRHYRVRAVNGAGSGEWSGPASATTERPELTARFEQAPAEHEGPDSTFTLRLVFSEAVAASYRNLRDHAITATNGAVRKSERVNGSSAEWNVTVAPSSREAVTVSVSGGSDACSQGDAVCTEDGRRLSNSPSVTVEGPPAVPLTAELDGVPGEHDGESTFTLGLTFSEEPRVSYRTLRDEAFDVDGGAVRNARRRQSGSDLSWEITVEPDSHADVSVRLPETGSCSASGAICTSDRRPLSHALSASVRGPAAMSVSDARVEEAAGAAVAFAVTLSRAASDRVTVDYQTRDGSAQAGEDYRAASGTLTFSAGEASKTIEVTVLDDAHDEGEETFTLALSNASGAWLEDAEATGTIENADLMPAALLARFGRATAEQVVEHVAERMAAPRERGFRARFAGREFQPGMERDFALGFLSQFGQPMGMGPEGAAPMGANPMGANPSGHGRGATGMTGRQPPMGAAGTMPGGPSGGAHGGGSFGSMQPGGDLFSNSEFELNREQHGGVVSVWSRSSRSHFGGMEGALSLNGDVRTTMLGADYRRGPLTVGLSVGRTLGLGGYGGRSAGQVTSSMTGFYPWLGYQVNDRVSVWGVTGYGTGALSLTPDGATALETGMSMAMTAAGTRGELIGSRATGGFALAFKADALWVGAATELVDGAAGRLNASQAGVTRVRTALEGSRGFSVGGRVSLTPSVEVGLRQDGGDAETGTGMDVGGGLALTDSVTGLSLDVRMRTLVVHQADGFTERGMSLSFGWDPTPSSPLGLTARVAPSWGGSAMGGADALWRSRMAYGMGSHHMAGSGGQVNAEVGYGLPVGRFVGTPSVGLGTSQYGRDYRLGYRLGLLERGGLDFGLDVSGTRRKSIMTPVPDHQVVTSATVTW